MPYGSNIKSVFLGFFSDESNYENLRQGDDQDGAGAQQQLPVEQVSLAPGPRKASSVSDFRSYDSVSTPFMTAMSTPISSGDSGRPRSDMFDMSDVIQSIPRVPQAARLDTRRRNSTSGTSSATTSPTLPLRSERQQHRVRFAETETPSPIREDEEDDPNNEDYEVPSNWHTPEPHRSVRGRVPTPFPQSHAQRIVRPSRSPQDRVPTPYPRAVAPGQTHTVRFGLIGSRIIEASPTSGDESTLPTPTRGGDQPRETGARRKTTRPFHR